MKKKINKQQNALKIQSIPQQSCHICKITTSKKYSKTLFQFNYQIIAKTINDVMQKPTYSSIINKILQRQPSKQLIAFQQIQKNLVFQQYLQQYIRFDKIPDKMKSLIPKHIHNVKANYMDFKIKNFLILNKYKVLEKPFLPYPLCTKFQKLTDSKMSSTKSVQNKVLQQLQKDIQFKQSTKRHNLINKNQQKIKKTTKNKKLSNQKFQIKALTKSIGQMIQNIKDVRALQNFKKQMQKSSQFKFGLQNFKQKQLKQQKKSQLIQILKVPKKFVQINELKQRQFKRKLQNDMVKYFPEQRKSPQLVKSSHQQIYHYPIQRFSKNKFSYKSTQRLQTIPDPDAQEYGLSVIRQKRKKSRSKPKKSKSKQNSRKSKESSTHIQFNSNKRLQTEYSSSSTQRLNTGYSMLNKSKSSSRIPTQYQPAIIIKPRKSKSKSKNENFLFLSMNKKQFKSSSIAQQGNAQNTHNFKKSKSKSKMNLLQFNASNKALKK